jgi:hypothetical protein
MELLTKESNSSLTSDIESEGDTNKIRVISDKSIIRFLKLTTLELGDLTAITDESVKRLTNLTSLSLLGNYK